MRKAITFTRDSSADIKSSYARDASNDITTTSVVGEVDAGSTVNYTVSKEANENNPDALYAWNYNSTYIYTKSTTPSVGDTIYSGDGSVVAETTDLLIGDYLHHSMRIESVDNNSISVFAANGSSSSEFTFVRNSGNDLNVPIYETKSGSVVVNDNTTLDVILEEISKKTLTIFVDNYYNLCCANLIINGVTYSIQEVKTVIPIEIDTNVTVECLSSYIKVYESSNANYISNWSAFPISFNMPNEDIWFTIYDTTVPT